MADQRIQYTEEMVGAGHATKADTLNRLALMFLNNDGSPIVGIKDVSVNVSNNTTDANRDIDFSAGSCFDATLKEPMVLASTLTKQIDATWAVGSNAGGRDSTDTLDASTLYALWLIKRSDTGVVDAMFSKSFTAPTIPTNYDFKRLVGAVATNSSSNIVAFTQIGDFFRFAGTLIQDVNDGTITTNNYEIGTLSAPPNSIGYIYLNWKNDSGSTGNMSVYVRPVGASELSNARAEHAYSINAAGSTGINDGTLKTFCLLDASSQFEYGGTEGARNTTVEIRTFAFDMLKRSNP